MSGVPKFWRLLMSAIVLATLSMVGISLAQSASSRRARDRETDELEIQQRSWISSSVRELSKRLRESDATGQTAQDPDREEKMALAALRRQEIPEATLPCSPDEARWWEELRTAGNQAKKGRDKDANKFHQLLKEGQEKSFQAPIPNRGPTFLRKFPPEYTEEARQLKVSGGIALVVEFLPDGTVGEVKIVQGLGYGMDERAAEAARKSVFLPAVKDARFVSVRVPMTMSFNLIK